MGLPPYKNEAYLDWSEESNQNAMRTALQKVEGELGGSYPLIVGGRRVETDGEITSVNPAKPSQLVGHVGRATEREADMALETATKTYETWSRTEPEARARILLRASAIMKRRRFELLAWEVYEGGKPWAEADAQVAEAIDFLEYYAREMLRLKDGKDVYSVAGEENRYVYQPMGVGVVIAPWNFPTAILTGMSSAAIVTGNTVVLKPSEHTSVIGAKVVEIFEEAGLPEGVLNFLPGYGSEIGDYLVDDARTRFISFTGSMKTGLRINERAAKQQEGQRWIKRVIAEMGGKDALVVDSSADLDAAANDLVKSAYGYSGQKCSAASRAILHQDIYDELLGKVVEKTRALKVGAPESPEVFVGPVQNEPQFEKVSGYIEVGDKEAERVLGEEPGDGGEGYFVKPTIYSEVSPQARLAQEEIFGPVLSVMKARDFDEALKIANDTPYGLTGGVYSRNRDHLERARTEFQAGNLYFNRTITGALVGVQPFGGFGLSGTDSKAGGPDYLPLHMLPRTVVERF
ncbi:D1pyr5carbox2: putative delta-1-pyrroline-5-carboxylate dehydrogenase [Rubrobacter radiotolerans]|uniref:L-glutamate gamma-semialdehyde dehydrogenase n=1 Tax=Rubrobacter radiotolerans TaxID=42256 RepID=A0A023X0N5_RUBRA|nr:L-glutamate gamma-semialdehyde dehydrogenase [Rubrobacter radiotolerans]AHY45604.1 D1pyr5carbox2: putative delta-1-pyrroline-5-carboxylate dehydrogenase [Rubrobacter radiotolerans]MDX5893017.1 L-glutamate gamma-semialdehyde dehydrogenase [Rubrobacter radiotolerans]SMC02908.1 delta-1-pyrroline-5-carboxylate dehydrogenase [Rubrobacter radiotolerans DSM 5868]